MLRGFGQGNRRTGPSIKDRIGFQTKKKNQGGLTTRNSAAAGVSSIKNRLNFGAKKGGPVIDARQKINLNKIQKGRVSDARQKLNAKRRQNTATTSRSGGIKTLKVITTNSPTRPQFMPLSRNGSTTMGRRPGGTFQAAFEELSPQRQSFTRTTTNSTRMSSLYMEPQRVTRNTSPTFLTRTISNPSASGSRYDSRSASGPRIAPALHYSGYRRESSPMAMDEDDYGTGLSSRLQARLDASEYSECRVVVSNLQTSVTSDDIIELFSDIAPIRGAKMTGTGRAEVVYTSKSDGLKAVDAYHNRLLDGSPMRVYIDEQPSSSVRAGGSSGSSTLKSAAGASMKLPKGSSSLKIQPDISAIHKVLFNPSSSGTRDLFKSGQGHKS